MKPDKPQLTCIGCGKQLSVYAAHVELADGKTHPVCSGRVHSRPSETCRKRAIEKLQICPGCGTPGETEPGSICATCKEDVVRGRVATKEACGLQWYGVNGGDWIPSLYAAPRLEEALESVDLPSGDSFAFALDRQIVELIANVISPHRRERADVRRAFSSITPILPPGDTKSDPWRHNDVALELNEAQATALRALLLLIGKSLKVQRTAGRAEGQSLLAQLAAGEITVNEWEKRAEKQRAGEDLDPHEPR